MKKKQKKKHERKFCFLPAPEKRGTRPKDT